MGPHGDLDTAVSIELRGGAAGIMPDWLWGAQHRQPWGVDGGVWASDFDADGRRQAFCFPVKGVREIPALKCSLEERHQHLLGKQMESGRGMAGAARPDGGGGGRERHGGLSRLLQCHGATVLTPYQHMALLLDLKSHRCENSLSTGKPKMRNWSHMAPYWGP